MRKKANLTADITDATEVRAGGRRKCPVVSYKALGTGAVRPEEFKTYTKQTATGRIRDYFRIQLKLDLTIIYFDQKWTGAWFRFIYSE